MSPSPGAQWISQVTCVSRHVASRMAVPWSSCCSEGSPHNIYIYIYIYISLNRQTGTFYMNFHNNYFLRGLFDFCQNGSEMVQNRSGIAPEVPRHFWGVFGPKHIFREKFETCWNKTWHVDGPETRLFGTWYKLKRRASNNQEFWRSRQLPILHFDLVRDESVQLEKSTKVTSHWWRQSPITSHQWLVSGD